MQQIKEIWSYRTMITSLVRREIKGRYKGAFLGFLWTFLTPLFQLIVYTLVFSVIMRAGIEDYYLFLFVALIPWNYFSLCISGGASCVVSQENMVNKIYFPREVLPIAHVLSQLVNMLLCFVVVIAVLLVSGKGIAISLWWYLPIIIFLETLLAFGFALFLSAISVYFRDIVHLMPVVTMAWQFLTPIMYSVDIVPESLQTYYYLNPMTPIIVAYRDIFYYQQAPQLDTLLSGLGFGILMLLIGWCTFGRLKRRFSEVM